jgi:hypothetical protein
VNLRLKDRLVARQAILDSVGSYEIVESYPNDKYFPSYLVLSSWADAGSSAHAEEDS